jgi:hypothetical protein
MGLLNLTGSSVIACNTVQPWVFERCQIGVLDRTLAVLYCEHGGFLRVSEAVHKPRPGQHSWWFQNASQTYLRDARDPGHLRSAVRFDFIYSPYYDEIAAWLDSWDIEHWKSTAWKP